MAITHPSHVLDCQYCRVGQDVHVESPIGTVVINKGRQIGLCSNSHEDTICGFNDSRKYTLNRIGTCVTISLWTA